MGDEIAAAVSDPQQTEWFDHRGEIMTAPYSDEPTGYNQWNRMTHWLMRPSGTGPIQAISWCGRRITEVPGRGEVDCPECLELLRAAGTEG